MRGSENMVCPYSCERSSAVRIDVEAIAPTSADPVSGLEVTANTMPIQEAIVDGGPVVDEVAELAAAIVNEEVWIVVFLIVVGDVGDLVVVVLRVIVSCTCLHNIDANAPHVYKWLSVL